MAAVSEIEKLEARYAENPDGRYFAPLADAYRKVGRVDDALQLVSQGITKHPDYLSAHIVLGRCHLDKSDDSAAAGAFERVLELDLENIIALKSLAEIAERAGDVDVARRWLQRLLAVDSMNTEAEEDLTRLGGPLPEEQPAEAAAEEEPGADISFADVAFAEADTVPIPALDIEPTELADAGQPPAAAPSEPVAEMSPPAPEAPAEEPAAVVFEEEAPAPAEAAAEPPPELEIESTSLAEAEQVAAAPEGLTSFDDSLKWGAGERMSGFVDKEVLEEAEQLHIEEAAPAIDFLPPAADAPPAEPEPAEQPEERAGLPLIMPEDVTPEDELRRPSSKQLEAVSRTAEEEAAGEEQPGAEPLLTETMAQLYLKQGFPSQAADVYRRLLEQRPDDESLRARLAELTGPRPVMSAEALGAESVGSWLRRVAAASLPVSPPEPPAEPEPGPTPMETAFEADAEPAAPPEVPGEPARPASEAFSLDQIFGGGSPPPEAGGGTPPPALGASFDEFFGVQSSGGSESVRPREDEGGDQPPGDDDLSAFNTWLHGLKK